MGPKTVVGWICEKNARWRDAEKHEQVPGESDPEADQGRGGLAGWKRIKTGW